MNVKIKDLEENVYYEINSLDTATEQSNRVHSIAKSQHITINHDDEPKIALKNIVIIEDPVEKDKWNIHSLNREFFISQSNIKQFKLKKVTKETNPEYWL